jgi:hypothetical protein
MELKDVLPLAFERFNAAVALWNLEAAVIFALLAFLASAPGMLASLWMRGLMTAAYVGFALVNGVILEQVEGQRRVLDTVAIGELPRGDLKLLAPYLTAPSWVQTLGIHLLADGAALAAIWIIPAVANRKRCGPSGVG